MKAPSIDIIIPTLNCARNLSRCLEAISNQNYSGQLQVIVVDGGSDDGTVAVAHDFGCRVFVNPGQYGVGLNGARHFGETHGDAELVWYIDSDNLLTGASVATNLSRPFMEDPQLNIAVPFVDVDPKASSFNNWISKVELSNLNHLAQSGTPQPGWLLVMDLWYGLPNAALLRRSSMEAAGGFDTDVALLNRLRKIGLSRAALVPSARYFNNQVVSAREFAAKWRRRIRRYGTMTGHERRLYFAPTPSTRVLEPATRGGIPGSLADILCRYPWLGITGFLSTRDRTWLWGFVFPLVVASASFRNPLMTWVAIRNFRNSVT